MRRQYGISALISGLDVMLRGNSDDDCFLRLLLFKSVKIISYLPNIEKNKSGLVGRGIALPTEFCSSMPLVGPSLHLVKKSGQINAEVVEANQVTVCECDIIV